MLNVFVKLLRIFGYKGIDIPIWCYGLECEVCKKTFTSPINHYEYVQKNNLVSEHSWKIPKIIKGDKK